MRAPGVVYNIPKDIKHVWITNMPNFTIEKVNVEEVIFEITGDITIKVEECSIWGNTIKAKINKINGKTFWLMKKSYHLTENEAALRMRDHFRKMLAENVNPTTARVMEDSKDQELMLKNVELFTEKYPEMTI